ncbi:MAG: twin-arginine translocation signal domain-containing protein, partial [Acidimicrobiales bacterium]
MRLGRARLSRRQFLAVAGGAAAGVALGACGGSSSPPPRPVGPMADAVV